MVGLVHSCTALGRGLLGAGLLGAKTIGRRTLFWSQTISYLIPIVIHE